MGKRVFIAEKPSVAQQFAKTLGVGGSRGDGYLEEGDTIVTWCVGHLITMSYPEVYHPKLRRWSLDTIPFIPTEWKYEVIPATAKQYRVVQKILTRPDVDTIYICTDSGREGEYIYRLVDHQAGVTGKKRLRVWIDSQTEEEIRRGIAEAKDWSFYDSLASSAYLRAEEDYLMGINFSRALTLKFGPEVASSMQMDRSVIAVGRVMTCVLGMVVRREREIRAFVPTPFYRVTARIGLPEGAETIEAEWRAVKGSKYFSSPLLYRENGFREKKDAEALIAYLQKDRPVQAVLTAAEKKRETRMAPLLYNLAELQNTCSRRFRISPAQTLSIVQELYEKKLVTYPRTDARVLSSAVAKEIDRNVAGLRNVPGLRDFAENILARNACAGIGASRYTDDSKITDHYAIIPTGQGFSALRGLGATAAGVYDLICRRFLAIFYPPAVYWKINLAYAIQGEPFFASARIQEDPGYLAVLEEPPAGAKRGRENPDTSEAPASDSSGRESSSPDGEGGTAQSGESAKALLAQFDRLAKGSAYPVRRLSIREGTTAPPKRYTSGSLILAMENAGQLIEDEDLREQIRGSGIGTSATRAEILKKLCANHYLKLNARSQIIVPERLGEAVAEVVSVSIRQLLNPDLTASWERGLTYVAEGTITPAEYLEKLTGFITRRTEKVKGIEHPEVIRPQLDALEQWYPGKPSYASSGHRYATRRRTDSGTRRARGGSGTSGKNTGKEQTT